MSGQQWRSWGFGSLTAVAVGLLAWAGPLEARQESDRAGGTDAAPDLERDWSIRFSDLQDQLRRASKIRSLAGQTYHRDALVLPGDRDPADIVIRRTSALLEQLKSETGGRNLGGLASRLEKLKSRSSRIDVADKDARRRLYRDACLLRRKVALADPLLDFDKILFVKRVPGSYSHMSDQYYGWWSRPGGGVYILEGFKSDSPRLKCLTSGMPEGSFLRPDLSFDGRKVLFSFCRYYPRLAKEKNKVDKSRLPEDAFYHIYQVDLDGSNLRRLTRGRYDDFDARYLPNGRIVFLSTRRGQFLQAGKASAMATLRQDALPDSYVRCGGGNFRPVAIYTLHVMDPDGGEMLAISPFENFEWTPSVAADGRILFARWDYVDRDNMPYMSLWSTRPDGTNLQIVYGNFTRNPYAIFEARTIPGSRKIVFTASAHHSTTGGSIVLLDVERGSEGAGSLKRLTPEVRFPEAEGWPKTWYAGPYPLSEGRYLASWSHLPLRREGGRNAPNASGIYLCDGYGNRVLLHRDPAISSRNPIPVRPRQRPPVLSSSVDWEGPQEGRFLLLDVYAGLGGVKRGAVKSLRIVGVPPKTQPKMNSPRLGVTKDDPGKFVLGTVPVEKDGSAYFRVPSGVSLFFQALDSEGMAVQTMRTVTHVQPRETLTCAGCHEPRNLAPRNVRPLAAAREPSRISPGPEGSWPLRFDRLVQPVLDQHCVGCHAPGAGDPAAARTDLTARRAYDTLISYGKPSLKDRVKQGYARGRSIPGRGLAKTSALLAFLREDAEHAAVALDQDNLARLITWMDTYAQRLGSFSTEQERRLKEFRSVVSHILRERSETDGTR